MSKQHTFFSCDDGNSNSGDGCSSSCQVEGGDYLCLGQGKPCEKCTRDSQAIQQGNYANPDPAICYFCLNDRGVNMSTPCTNPACGSIGSIDDAIACDNYVHTYCGALADSGS